VPRAHRPEQPEPYLRGCAWPASAGVAYPRADPADMTRLPIDTWATAQIPATVRLEFVGDADAVEVAYRTATDDMGYRGDGAGRTFSLWYRGEKVADAAAVLGDGRVVLAMPSEGRAAAERSIVYLPEGMKPVVVSVSAVGGSIEPAPTQPRWLAYGDSVAEGWIASEPALAWPAIAGRRFGLDVVNAGYAGSARGEVVSAEHLAGLGAAGSTAGLGAAGSTAGLGAAGSTAGLGAAGSTAGVGAAGSIAGVGAAGSTAGLGAAGSIAVISISHGTNCWTRIPHSAAMMLANTAAFLEVVRQGHPDVPIVVASPVLRPDAERTPNRLGATLVDLRAAMEEAVHERIEAGDRRLTLVPGGPLLTTDLLADGIHPGDEGHHVLAAAIGGAVAQVLEQERAMS
jgi:lysophospholipase L1-like esterase